MSCTLDAIPYFREIALGLIVALMAASFFIREKCSCQKEIAELKERLEALENVQG